VKTGWIPVDVLPSLQLIHNELQRFARTYKLYSNQNRVAEAFYTLCLAMTWTCARVKWDLHSMQQFCPVALPNNDDLISVPAVIEPRLIVQ